MLQRVEFVAVVRGLNLQLLMRLQIHEQKKRNERKKGNKALRFKKLNDAFYPRQPCLEQLCKSG